MRQITSLIIYAILVFCFLACQKTTKPYPLVMLYAEDLMVQKPEKALSLLETYGDSIKLEPEKTQWYYKLLLVKAKDKAYILHTSDSLICAITHYYENEDDRDKLMESYYYMGRVYWDLQDSPRALKYFQKAINISGDTQNFMLLSRIYTQMGALLSYQDVYEDVIPLMEKSYQYRVLAKDSFDLCMPIRDIARVYDMMGRKDSAIIYYKKAFQLAKKMNNDKRAIDILGELSDIYGELGRYSEAFDCFCYPQTDVDPINLGPHYCSLGDLFLRTGQLDSAYYYLQKGVKYGNIYTRAGSLKSLFELEETRLNYKEALQYAHLYLQCEDSIKKITNSESIRKVQALYNYQKSEVENQQLRLDNAQKQLWIICSILIGLIVLFVVWFFMYRKQRKEEALLLSEKRIREEHKFQYMQSLACVEENKQKIELLSVQLHLAEQQKDVTQQELIKTQQNLLELTNQKIIVQQKNKMMLQQELFCSDIYVKFYTASQNSAVLIKGEDWLLLQGELDATYNNMTNRLYALYPKLSLIELRICYLAKISISVSNMTNLLNRSKSTISSSRSRLCEKFFGEQGNLEKLDSFIADL